MLNFFVTNDIVPHIWWVNFKFSSTNSTFFLTLEVCASLKNALNKRIERCCEICRRTQRSTNRKVLLPKSRRRKGKIISSNSIYIYINSTNYFNNYINFRLKYTADDDGGHKYGLQTIELAMAIKLYYMI